MTGPRPKIDSQLFRQSLGCFPTGVIVATTLGDNEAPVGLTINSFSSLSLQPPLVLWNIALTSPSLEAFRRHPGFTLNPYPPAPTRNIPNRQLLRQLRRYKKVGSRYVRCVYYDIFFQPFFQIRNRSVWLGPVSRSRNLR